MFLKYNFMYFPEDITTSPIKKNFLKFGKDDLRKCSILLTEGEGEGWVDWLFSIAIFKLSYIPKQIENLWKFDIRSYYAIVGAENFIKLLILPLE